MHICHSLTIICIRMAVILILSFPHNLILDSQPRFGLTQFEFLNLNNFLIKKPIFMKIFVKFSDFVSLSYEVQVKVCNPIPLIKYTCMEIPLKRSLMFCLK